MAGNKAMRRALETGDAIRVNANIPLIEDKTELITPAIAMEMLKHNSNNRPINWRKVEQYADLMKAGQWKLHGQGLILDTNGNVLTGQKRLWAVVKSQVNVYFRVSRGNPPETAKLIDRGDLQSARDLASRDTERRHSPTEASIARAIAVTNGIPKPTVDEIANIMALHAEIVARLLKEAQGTKKTRGVLMILAAIATDSYTSGSIDPVEYGAAHVPQLPAIVTKLEQALRPETPEGCWNKGAAFTLAMGHALRIVQEL